MRAFICALLVCGCTLLAGSAAAQSSTEDGIRAVVSGDYQAAARILKPLGNDWTHPDPIAQFFMAVLYQTGQGVEGDFSRGCTLFLRAAGRVHPFTEQAAAISAALQEQLGAGAASVCVGDERWQGGPPVSFILGPGHRILFADTSITVTHGDKEQRTSILLPRGAVFLPILHTPITVTTPSRRRRDFIQWFAWTPDSIVKPKSWRLSWTLFEVVGDRVMASAGEPHLALVEGVTPPVPYDVASLVRLQTNANGEVDVTIAGGPSPRTTVIPPVPDR